MSAPITFQVAPVQVGEYTMVLLPVELSRRLASRGMCMVEGEINSAHFQAPLEPGGRGNHWLHLTEALLPQAPS